MTAQEEMPPLAREAAGRDCSVALYPSRRHP